MAHFLGIKEFGMKKNSKVVSVKFTDEEFINLTKVRDRIEKKTNLPVSLHYLLKRTIQEGFETLRSNYSSV